MIVWYMFVVVMLVMAGGLAVDGGESLQAYQQAQSVARSAARAGGDQLDVAAWRAGAGPQAISQADMQKAACGWVAEAIDDTSCQVSVSAAGTVTVTTVTTRPTKMMHMVGVNSVTATASKTVRVAWGASKDESA